MLRLAHDFFHPLDDVRRLIDDFFGQSLQALAAPAEVQIDGVTWKCDGDKCVGRAERRSTLDSQIKECRKVAEALGELKEYSSRGRPMTSNSVETCNRLASNKEEEMVASK